MQPPHGAAIFFFHRSTGRVLLQHRTDDAPVFPGHWGMFGGGAEPEDERDPVRTIRREVQEELGLDLDPDRIIRLSAYPLTGTSLTSGRGHRHVFICLWEDPDYPFVQTEGQGRDWFTVDEALDTLTLTDNARRDLFRLAERLTSPINPLVFPDEQEDG
jgi:8-oxo-dGTP pyrophosphatase MutT (NUDIX family)